MLTEEEKSDIKRANYGAETQSANRTIGRYICAVCEEGILITEGREGFAVQRMKDTVTKRLLSSGRVGEKTKRSLASNYTHYAIKNKIWIISYKRLRDRNFML